MANLDFDPSAVDPNAVNPAIAALTRSQPVPGIVTGAIPGIKGVVSPGLWDPNNPNAGWDPNTGKQTVMGGGDAGAIDRLRSGVTGADAAVGLPSTRRTVPDVIGSLQAGGQAAAPDDIPPKLVRTTREARSGDAPGRSLATVPEENAAMPPTAQPTQGSMTPSSGAHLFPEGSLLDRLITNIGNFRDQNRLTLLAMAGGLAGSQNWGTGLSRAFTAAVPAQRQDILQNNQNATAMALMNNFGVKDPNLARALATNPQMMQELLPYISGTNKNWQLGEEKDILGQTHPFLYSSITGERRELSGGARAGGGGGVAGPGGLPGGISSAQWDQMTPDQRFAVYQQAYPEIAGALKAYHEGRDVPPTRMPAVKMIAPNIWPDYNENVYTENRTLATGLMKDSPNSTGGLIKNGLSTFGHTADAAEAAAAVGDVGPRWAPNWVGNAANLGYNALVAGQTQHGNLEAQSRAFGTAGQEATKFYTAAGGSAPERMEGKEVANQSATAGERAGWLRETSKLLLDRVQIVMGPVISNPAVGAPWVQRNIASFQKAQADLTRMDKALAQLDPGGPEAQALAAGRPTPNMQRFSEILGPMGAPGAAPQTQAPPAAQGQPAAPAQRPGGVTPNGVRWSIQ